MKKHVVLLMLLLLMCLPSFAIRSYFQKVVADDPSVDILTLVTSTLTSYTSPNYLVTADIIETPGEVLSTGITPTTSITLRRSGNGTTTPFYAVVFVQLSTFPTPWVSGQTVRWVVTYIGTGPSNGQSVTWDHVIESGTAAINITNPVVRIPPLTAAADPNPTAATYVAPVNNALEQAISGLQLQWTYTHDAQFTDPTHFLVTYGTDPLLLNGTTTVDVPGTVGTYSTTLPTLNYGTAYYWQVLPTNAGGISKGKAVSGVSMNGRTIMNGTRGDYAGVPVIWTFTTMNQPIDPNPTLATNPLPANMAFNVPITTANISWNYTSEPFFTDPVGYKVYFGTNSDVIQNPMTYVAGMANMSMPVTLNYATVYYWRVVPTTIFSIAARGSVTRGDAVGAGTWYFGTEPHPVSPNPALAINPVPANGAINVAQATTTLHWNYAVDPLYTNPVGYKVYLHTNGTFTENALSVPYLYIAGIANTQAVLPITLAYNTHYYWKVVPTTDTNRGDAVDVATWDFMTESQPGSVPNPAVLAAPANGGTNVLVNALLSWTNGGGGTTGYRIYVGTDNPPTNTVNATDLGIVTSYSLQNLNYSTLYNWQVVPYNSFGNATDCPIWSFTTMDNPTITTFPYVQGFEGTNFPPLGWNMNGWMRGSGSHGGSYSAIALKNHVGVSILSTPSVVLTENKYISFWWKDSDISRVADHDSTFFEISTNAGSQWTTLATLSQATPDIQYREFSTSLGAYAGQTVQFRWRDITDGTSSATGVGLDDITIGTFIFAPPQNLVATPGYGVIDLTWQMPAGRSLTAYKVYRNGFYLASTAVGINSYNDNNVVNNVSYTYYVTADYTSPTYESVPSNTVQSTPLIPVFNPIATFTGNLASYNSITLQWTQMRARNTRSISGFKIYRNSTLAVTITNPATASWTDTNLAIGTYAYYIVCTYSNPDGESVPSTTIQVEVPVYVFNPPTNLAGTTTYNSVSLSWTAPTGSSGPVSNYKVYRNSTLLITVDPSLVVFTDNTVTSGTTYTYYVKAVYTVPVGESGPSNSAVLTPPLPVFNAPSNLVGVPAIASVSLTWTAPAAGSTGTLSNYKIYRNATLLVTIAATTPAYTDNTATNNEAYTYTVKAGYINPIGISAESNSAVVTPIQPVFNPPTNLTAVAGNATVALAWTAPDAGSNGTLSGYKLYRNSVLLITLPVTGVTYADNTVSNGTAYTYAITAVYTNLTGESAPSNTASATPLLPVYNPPTNLTAVAGNATVSLAWTAPAAGSTGTFAHYKLFRNGVILLELPVTGTTYTDTNVTNGTAYTYHLTAVYTNWDGESVPSNNATATPLLPTYNPPTNLTGTSISFSVTLNWSAPAAGSTGTLTNYKVFRNSVLLATLPPATMTYTDNTVVNGTIYTYYVTAVYTNWDGESVPSNSVIVTPPLPVYYPPTNLTVTSVQAVVTLNWVAPTPAAGTTLTGYNVYRDNVVVHTITGTTTTWNENLPEGLYAYKVTATYIGAESAASNEVGITVANSDPVAVLATSLKGCYPNPFNPTTTIAYSVKTANHVVIEIYSVKGQKVKTLVNGMMNAGAYTIRWNGTDNSGKTMGSGVYFYRMVAGNYTDTKKMIMLK